MYVICYIHMSRFSFFNFFSMSLLLNILFERDSYSNAYLLTKFGFDTAENEPSKVYKIFCKFCKNSKPSSPCGDAGNLLESPARRRCFDLGSQPVEPPRGSPSASILAGTPCAPGNLGLF